MTTPDLIDLSGQTIKGYVIQELIMRGGFGAVYRAYQPVVEREVAIKIILPKYANNPDFIRRFDAEAHLIARLEHIHIVPLYDYWREPDNAYLVMRWLRGGSLHDSLHRYGTWKLSAASRLLDQIASALTAAHRRDIIHSDLKPDNILLDEDQNAYLTDFGIAQGLIQRQREGGERFGTPNYMSPEQITGSPLSPQSDIYSLGIVLYEVLTGSPPFNDPSYTEVMHKHLTDVVPPLQVTLPDLPYPLNLVIWRATSKRSEDRYPDVMSMAADFRQIVQSKTTSEVVLTPDFTASPVPAQQTPAVQTLVIDAALEPENPYKGLRAFQESDAGDFFGREKLIQHLLNRLSTSTDPTAVTRFLAVVGPSGCGKSSVVSAGLLPLLRRGMLRHSDDWFYVQITPGHQPFVKLAEGLRRIALNDETNLVGQLREHKAALLDTISRLLPDDGSELLLMIDQFEELFTLTEDETERQFFLDTLYMAVTEPDSRLRIVITLRADFYDRPLLYTGFGELMRTCTEVVLPLAPNEMEQAIISPAKRLFINFEPELVTTIIADVSEQPGALPLLQYALTELFERREERMLTHAAYHAIGGVTGALVRRADELYTSLDTAGQAAARQLFLRLVNLGDGVEDTRRRVLRSELMSIRGEKRTLQQIIDLFGKYRLLTFDHEPVTRAPSIELAHEALIRVWTQLRGWLDTNRDSLRLQRRLAAATTEWINASCDPSFLASGARLAQFEMLLNTLEVALNQQEVDYLHASIRQRQQARLRLRVFIAALVGAVIAAFGLALFAFDRQAVAVTERDRANLQANISRSRELAVTALTNTRQLDLSLLLSLEALNVADTFEARSSLLTSLQVQPQLVTFLRGHTDWVRSVAYAPNGNLIASGSRDNTIRLWDVHTHQPSGEPLAGHTDWINSVAFSADSQLLASASSDDTVRVWDVRTHQPLGEPLTGHNADVWAVAFSVNDVLASAGADGTVRLWDARTGKPLGEPLTGHGDVVYALAFSPDGQTLASGGADNTIRLWDVETSEPRGNPLVLHDNWVLSLAFSPDGTLLVSSGADRTIVFWNAATGEPLARFQTGQSDWVRSLSFSADGKLLASGSADGTIQVWDATSGQPVSAPLHGHTDGVWSVAFDPVARADEGQVLLASGGADDLVILWDAAARHPLGQEISRSDDSVASVAFDAEGNLLAYGGGRLTGEIGANTIHLWNTQTARETAVLQGHQGLVTSLAFSPTEDRLISASIDRTLILWDSAEGKALRAPFAEHERGILSVTYSPDGKIIASGDEAGTIRLWNAGDGAALFPPLTGHEDSVLSVAFSPDGRLLASGSRDSTIRLWDAASGQSLGAALAEHADTVASVAFSPDGETLASASYDGTVLLWDVRTRQPLGQALVGHTGEVWTVAFSPDGRTLASGGQDNTVILWDVETRQRLGLPLTGQTDWVTSVVFRPDGQMIASGSLDRSVMLWDVDLESWRARACRVANRSLSLPEWNRYFRQAPYHQTCAS